MKRCRGQGDQANPVWYTERLTKTAGGQQAPRAWTFEQLYRVGLPDVWRWLHHCGVAAQDRADVAAEVFLQVHKALPAYDPERGSPRTWLRTITLHMASHERDRAYRRRETPCAVDHLPADETSVADVYEQQQELRLLGEIVASLPAKLRDVVVAKDLEQRSMQDIADERELPVQTVYKQLYRGRDEIRRRWARRTGERRRAAVLPLWLFRSRRSRPPASAWRAVFRRLRPVWRSGLPGPTPALPAPREPASPSIARNVRRVVRGAVAFLGAACVSLSLRGGAPAADTLPRAAMAATAAAPSAPEPIGPFVDPVSTPHAAAVDSHASQVNSPREALTRKTARLSPPVAAPPSAPATAPLSPPVETPFAEARAFREARVALAQGRTAMVLAMLARQDRQFASGQHAAERDDLRKHASSTAASTSGKGDSQSTRSEIDTP